MVKNFNLERFIQELTGKKVITNKEGKFFASHFKEFSFEPSLEAKSVFFNTINNEEDCRQLDKKICEARNRFALIKADVISRGVWFDFILDRYSPSKRVTFKKIYLFILEHTK